jgi:hypothetical protein
MNNVTELTEQNLNLQRAKLELIDLLNAEPKPEKRNELRQRILNIANRQKETSDKLIIANSINS